MSSALPMNGLLGMLDLTLDTRLNSEQREQLEQAQPLWVFAAGAAQR